MSTRSTLLLVLVVALACRAQIAHAVPMTVVNHSFQDPITPTQLDEPLDRTDVYCFDPVGWDIYDPHAYGYLPNDCFISPWDPNPAGFLDPVPDGNQTLFVYNVSDPLEVGVEQTVGIVAPDANYSFSVAVGNIKVVPAFPNLNGFPGYVVQLVANAGGVETVLADDNNTVTILGGRFETVTLAYNAGSDADPLIGQTLTIRLMNRGASFGGGEEVDFDNVELDATSIISLGVTVDRDTGDVTLTNTTPTATPFQLAGSSLQSSGGLNPGNWNSIATNYDEVANGGNGSVDSNHTWAVATSTSSELSESQVGGPVPFDGGEIGDAEVVNMGDGLWVRSPIEDVALGIELTNGVIYNVPVTYTGTPILLGDFNLDGNVTSVDWPTQRDNFNADLSAKTDVAAYFMGDLNGDFVNNFTDQFLFKQLYEAANGAGSFSAMVNGVPEPNSLVLMGLGSLALLGRRRARRAEKRKLNQEPICAMTRAQSGAWGMMLVAMTSAMLSFGAAAQARVISLNFSQDAANQHFDGGQLIGPLGTDSAFWNNTQDFPGQDLGNLQLGIGTNLIDDANASTGVNVTWNAGGVWFNGDDQSIDDGRLASGYLDDNNPGATINFSGIP